LKEVASHHHHFKLPKSQIDAGQAQGSPESRNHRGDKLSREVVFRHAKQLRLDQFSVFFRNFLK